MRHARGYYVNIETVGKLISEDGSNFTGGVFISRDITHRKLLQNLQLENERLEVALVKEKEFTAYRTRMMQYINHEFRTPLAVIQASAQTLSSYWERLQPEQRTAKVVEIENQIERITHMLEEIDFVLNNRFRSDLLHLVPTHLSELCRIVAADLEQELNLADKYHFENEREFIIAIDPNMVKKAFFHILRNAAQYSKSLDPVDISIVVVSKGVEVRVMDQGEGIPEDEQRRVFEPFFRGTTTQHSNGLGIGLTIAKSIIEAHKGQISIMTVRHKGTTVTIWLPQ